MSDGNSGREVSINTNSTITTTILVDNTGGIPVVDTPNPTLADATTADEITTFTLVVDGVGPTLTTKTLSAGTDIALVPVGNAIRIDNAGATGGAGSVVLQSQGGAPAAGDEFALFTNADPDPAATTLSFKKLKSTTGTVTIADDGEFIDLGAVLGATSGTITSIADAAGATDGASIISYGLGPQAVIKRLRARDAKVSITSDSNYIYIGMNFAMTNTLAESATSYQLVSGSASAPVVRTLKPGAGISLVSDATSITISADSSGINNVRIANNTTNTAVSSGTHSVAIGHNTNASDTAIAIGVAATATLDSVAIGVGCHCTTDDNVAIGFAADATSTNCTAVGASAEATALNCTAVGAGSVASQDYCTLLGTSLTTTAPNAILIGNDIANVEQHVLRIQTDDKRLLTSYGPNNAWGPRTITAGPLWSRTGNLARYDAADFVANVATLPASAIAPGNFVFISRGALSALGDMKLPNYATVLAVFGATAPVAPGPSWWFRIVNNDGSNSCQITKQSATPDTYIYGQDGNDSGAGFGLGQTQMVAIAAWLDVANSKMKYSVMVKYG